MTDLLTQAAEVGQAARVALTAPARASSPDLGLPLAHGVGSRHDLPLSPFYAYAGAFAALLISFLALGLLWSSSRFRGDLSGRPLPAALQRVADAPATRAALRLLGAVAALVLLLHLLLGPDDPDRNPAPGALYVLLWVGLVPASLLFGPVWRLLNPLRALHALHPPHTPRPLPAAVGIRPAALGLLLFTWLELVAPDNTSSRTLLIALAAHTGAQLIGAGRYGDRWFAHADPFEVYSSLLSRLSPLGRRADGRTSSCAPLPRPRRHPADPRPRRHRLCPPRIHRLRRPLGQPPLDHHPPDLPLGPTPTATLGLLAAVALVAACYGLCAGALRLMNRTLTTPLTSFAHSLLPIALGYLVAHYFSLFVTEGLRTVILAGGTDNALAPAPFLGPGGLATLQVAAIVTGHVLGVVAAHDRSVRLFPPDRAVASTNSRCSR